MVANHWSLIPQVDAKSLAALLATLFFLALRWRWDYFIDLYQHPKKAMKFLAIWLLLALVLLRVYWQLKPAYFS